MKSIVLSVFLAAAAVTAGCDGTSGMSEKRFCEESVDFVCRVGWECLTQEQRDMGFFDYGTSRSDCVSMNEMLCVAGIGCDTDETYDAAAALECANAFQEATCTDIMGPEPEACDRVCVQTAP
jgi:hypothetical protein